MTRKNGLPRRVYLRHGAFYYVTLAGKWMRLCAQRDGLPGMYRALATITEGEAARECMPAVIARWLDAKRPGWAPKTLADQERVAREISEAFREFSPADVTTPACHNYLKDYAATPRTHNIHRTALRQILAFAALEGLREGYNPIDNVPTKSTPGRKRIVTNAEIAAVKAGALQQSRNGEALVQMIDLALLTGQRIGDLIKMRWQDVTADGIRVRQGKTGEALLIEWSAELREAIDACAAGRERIGHVLKTQSGTGYRYGGVHSAWDRACARAGVTDLHIHDLRGRAGVDKRQADGLESAKELLGHRSIRMTEHYVDGKSERRVKPAGRR